MTHKLDDIEGITRLTLDYYERNAAEFFEGTREHLWFLAALVWCVAISFRAMARAK